MSERGTGDRRTRRTRRTRQMLEQALLELIEEQNYEAITIQQIAETATAAGPRGERWAWARVTAHLATDGLSPSAMTKHKLCRHSPYRAPSKPLF